MLGSVLGEVGLMLVYCDSIDYPARHLVLGSVLGGVGPMLVYCNFVVMVLYCLPCQVPGVRVSAWRSWPDAGVL